MSTWCSEYGYIRKKINEEKRGDSISTSLMDIATNPEVKKIGMKAVTTFGETASSNLEKKAAEK